MASARPTLDEVLALVDEQRALDQLRALDGLAWAPPSVRAVSVTLRGDTFLLAVSDEWGGVEETLDVGAWVRALAACWERYREHELGVRAVEGPEATADVRILTPVRGPR